jgi:hypothetical protein
MLCIAGNVAWGLYTGRIRAPDPAGSHRATTRKAGFPRILGMLPLPLAQWQAALQTRHRLALETKSISSSNNDVRYRHYAKKGHWEAWIAVH